MYSEYNMYVNNIISCYLQIVKINKNKLLVIFQQVINVNIKL